MANSILTPTMITNEALFVLQNKLGIAANVNREYEDQFANDGAKIGTVLNVRKPAQMGVSSAQSLAAIDYTEQQVALTVDQYRHVPAEFTNSELTLSLDRFSDRVIQPAMSQLASSIDSYVASLYNGVPNVIQSSSALTYNDVVDAGALLTDMLAPDDSRTFALSGRQMAAVVKDNKSLFNSSKEVSNQFVTGLVDEVSGFMFKRDTLTPIHTVGPLGGTPLVNGAAQTGSSLITDGWTAAAASRLLKGDVFTIAGVFSVNPVTKASTGVLQQFVVTADFSSNASGQGTVSIYPAITTSGVTQTVSGSPADNAAITIQGTAATNYRSAVAFHKDAITLATIDQALPKGVDMAARASSKEAGLSIRMVRQWDNRTNSMTCRFDVLFGAVLLRPEHVVRVHTTV